MTEQEKLSLIDAYLTEENIDRNWREMVMEYRSMLVLRQKSSVDDDFCEHGEER